jgi:Cu(I)/Ag(I) efflux system membrane protein CusA/SilA
VIPDRDAIARYGLSVRDVHDVVEAAVGGMPVSTVIAGRSRFSINLRYAADYRADPEALRSILIPVQASEPLFVDTTGSGAGAASTMSSSGAPAMRSGGGAMGSGMGAMGGPPPRVPASAWLRWTVRARGRR